MKKHPLIISVFILVVSIFFIIILTDQQKNSDAAMIQKAFSVTGAEVVSSEIFIRGRLNDKSCEKAAERQQLLHEIINGAGGDTLVLKPVFTAIDSDTGFGTVVDYIINNNNNIHVSILKDRQNDAEEKYHLTISLVDTSQQPELEDSVEGITKVLSRYKMEPSVNIRITGSLNGRLKDSELEAICEKVFMTTKADKVEGMRDKDLISVSAFSPSIGNAVRVNGKSVNLNVAIRFNSYEGKTYIWLATPVITTEY